MGAADDSLSDADIDNGVSHPKETEDTAFRVFIEDPRPVLDIPDILDGIEKIRVFPGDDREEPG